MTGAGDGFDEFYSAAYRRIVGQVFAFLGDLPEAEDVAQDAFARASFHWSRVRTYDMPEAWVRRVAFNLAHNRTRRVRRGLAALARHGPPAPVPAASADRVDLHHALRRIPLRHREVLVLRYVAELSLEEVASQLRLPVGTVKSRLSRARRALAEQLGEQPTGVRHA